jgi:hypothetical protein
MIHNLKFINKWIAKCSGYIFKLHSNRKDQMIATCANIPETYRCNVEQRSQTQKNMYHIDPLL